MRKVELLSNFSAQELTELLQTFSGSNLQGNYENNTCLSLQTSIDENDENLTTVHHRYLRKYLLIFITTMLPIRFEPNLNVYYTWYLGILEFCQIFNLTYYQNICNN